MGIFGHKTQQKFLQRIIESGNIPHAFLFSGPSGLGKKTLALEFLGQLNGKKLCQTDPDLLMLFSEKGDIPIAQIRMASSFLNLKPFSARFKQVIIDRAERMRQDSQNCLLKTLEEPPQNSLIFLISARPEMLFETVLSRCQRLKFHLLPDEEMRTFLKDKTTDEEQLTKILFFSEGRPGRALNFIANPGLLDGYCSTVGKIGGLVSSDIVFRFQYLKNFFETKPKRKKVAVFLDLLLKYFRTVFLLKLGAGRPSFFEQIFLKTSQSFSLRQLKDILRSLEETRFLIEKTNINPKLALENLFLKI